MIAIARFWHSLARIEKAVLLFSSAGLLFFAGSAWARNRQIQTLPPIFEDAPQLQNATSETSDATITVHVAGAVANPGVLQLPSDARVSDALQKAGGAKSDGDLNALNLAQILKDGQQILVPIRGAQTVLPDAGLQNGNPKTRAVKTKAPPHPINVNTASAEELQTLPGIGPALAARILARRAQGRFSSLADLDEVSGLGPKKLAALKPFVRF